MIEVSPALVKEYLKGIIRDYKLGNAVEATFRPTFVNLINGLGDGLHAMNEARQIQCGSPDVPIFRGKFILGHVEFKDIGVNLDNMEKTEQLHGYLDSLHNLMLSDYLEFRWFINGKFIRSVRVASVDRNGKIVVDDAKVPELVSLLEEFLRQEARKIDSPAELSTMMAHIARGIRDNVLKLVSSDQESDMVKDIRRTLSFILPDIMDEDKAEKFVDMYAQTIVYGLFVARCNHTGPEPFNRMNASSDIPKTNPFVRALFENVMSTALSDEPYFYLVEDMVAILSNTDIDKILEGFSEAQSNPVIYFYESFLTEYDKSTKFALGVFYTPEPVVSYIIQSVDFLLKKKFLIEDGIANTQKIKYKTTVQTTKKEGKKTKLEDMDVEKECHRILLLDPCCGTGAFIYETIRYIRFAFMENNNAGLWPMYVREHLIPRLFGFEILVSPYTISHFNISMELKGRDLTQKAREKWAYKDEDQRLNIYLTDTLNESEETEDYFFRFINHEVHESSIIKDNLPIMVVMGNPPYNARSTNVYDISEYKQIDGVPLGERTWNALQDDYVKFIRWAQKRIEKTGYGVIAFITNHSYLDNLTFRGMRKSLMDTFDEIYILDLHGNSSKKEKCPDGSKDENVFDIKQGVAIGLFVKKSPMHTATIVKHADLYGIRNDKYNYLASNSAGTTSWSDVSPQAPNYLFKQIKSGADEYISYSSLDGDIFVENSSGTETGNDDVTMAFKRGEIESILDDFIKLPDNEGREKYDKVQNKSGSSWSFDKAKHDVVSTNSDKKNIVEIIYRPMDKRYTYFTGNSMGFHRRPGRMMAYLANKDNLAIISVRQVAEGKFNHAFVTKTVAEARVVISNKGRDYVFPIFTYQGDKRSCNINPEFIIKMEASLKLKFGVDFTPEDVLYYIYAILNSPTYRTRYAGFLQYDYPRIPVTSNVDKFRSLCKQGRILTELHLLENIPVVLKVSYPVTGDDIVTKSEYKDGKLYINDKQYFEGVPAEVNNFVIGGHQAVKKWLDARKERKLDYTDFEHLKKMFNAISFTMTLQGEIDKVIGGFPIT